MMAVQLMVDGCKWPRSLLLNALGPSSNGRSAKKWHQWPSFSAIAHHDKKAARARVRVECEVMTANNILLGCGSAIGSEELSETVLGATTATAA